MSIIITSYFCDNTSKIFFIELFTCFEFIKKLTPDTKSIFELILIISSSIFISFELFSILLIVFSEYFFTPKMVCKLLFKISKSIIKILFLFIAFAKLTVNILLPIPLVPFIQIISSVFSFIFFFLKKILLIFLINFSFILLFNKYIKFLFNFSFFSSVLFSSCFSFFVSVLFFF